ncbi:beta-mannosidase [Pedobacter sp. ASV12]|uniref:beta-mannosidase n=1 Tax=Pedobacter sp. ASV12 TaxID=2795120 RepID=UPI0018ED2F9C|nr:glycoside hydrolase family 2 protein [Pedobacter sp. ASV12]
MKNKYTQFALMLLLAFFVCRADAQVIVQKLNANWQFQEQDEAKWYPAKVPGEVHTDLLRNQLIHDPFYRDNEKKVQWVERENWDYKSSFGVEARVFGQKQIELVFDGLDTYADVYLNGKLILQADNMFRQWRIDVKKWLKAKDNQLRIRFYSAQNKVDSMAKADLPFVIPDDPRAYVRKAQFHFGWDWGPKLTGCGIWKEVRLEAYNQKPAEKPFVAPVQVELVQKPDDKGSSFYFSINGKPTYMKGANYIPSDAFVTRMKKADYRKMLMMAKDAHMNMLRVWGGGIYESDDFYNLCDSLGIYVWQDFMFAGTMVPGDKHFIDNVREEVKYQVKRLRHHKSIVVWCGNNEIDEAFNRWGWQSQFRLRPKDSVKLWQDYTQLFRDSIPKWIKEAGDARPYVSTSPKYGWGVKTSITEGDSHYWGTWWGGEDFEVFENKTGRFVSEYGMQAMPNYSSILAFTQPQDRYLASDVMQSHQKAGNGYQKLNGYLKNYMIDESRIGKLSVEDYTYLTQCVQYYGFKNMILIHRSKEPYNMGTLLWQLNDCWPVASWSITDYYHRAPKAAWYAVKEAYRDDVRPARDTVRPKDLKLSDPQITYRVKGNQIVLRAKAFAKYVFVDIAGYTGKLSDNYFDLEPGKEKVITFDAKDLVGQKPVVKIKSLWEVVR